MSGCRVTKIRALIADIGATHARVAWVDEAYDYHDVAIHRSADFNAPDEVIHAYCQTLGIERPQLIVLAIAAPVELDDVHFVNNHWQFKLSDVKARLAPSTVHFYNDVEMLGAALPHLPESSLVKVGGGELSPYAPKLAMSLGSGIGTSLVVHHHNWLAIPSEGGHSAMMMEDQEIVNFWQMLRCSGKDEIIVEDFIGGRRGIPQLIDYMTKLLNVKHKDSSPMALVSGLIDKKDTFAVQLFGRYCAMIGGVAKNYTLITGAKSVYLAGGIIPRFLEFFVQSDFRSAFEHSASVFPLLQKIPTFVVTDPYPALTGLVQTIAFMEDE
nr:glucokinase [Wohlfahrtiimonas chitiniclastica]